MTILAADHGTLRRLLPFESAGLTLLLTLVGFLTGAR